MNAMEFAREKKRRESKRETLRGVIGGIGMMLMFVASIGLIRELHPVTCTMFTVGALALEAAIFMGRAK